MTSSDYSRAADRSRNRARMVLQHGAGDASIDTLLKASSFLHAAEAFEREARRLAELGKD